VAGTSGQTRKPRPYWHVDAKWVTSLLLVPLLAAAFLLYSLVQMTAERPAVEAMTLVLAVMFSGNTLDDETDIALFRGELEADPDGCIRPIDALQVEACEDDLAGLSPREARLFLFRQMAQPLYAHGAEGLVELAADPETAQVMDQGIGALSLFTLETHQVLQRALRTLAIVCGVLFIPLMLFSHRFGRIGTPGCAIFVAALPGALLFAFFAFGFHPPPSPPGERGLTELLGSMATNVLPVLAKAAIRSYALLVALGLLLILIAILATVIARLRRRQNGKVNP